MLTLRFRDLIPIQNILNILRYISMQDEGNVSDLEEPIMLTFLRLTSTTLLSQYLNARDQSTTEQEMTIPRMISRTKNNWANTYATKRLSSFRGRQASNGRRMILGSFIKCSGRRYRKEEALQRLMLEGDKEKTLPYPIPNAPSQARDTKTLDLTN
ncbi:hypothetical protein Tco_0842103 [Tanacetum coccineum]|uniref:Uncharacterized protein n=1 Tax=Tanacetum coccineum TaxID=301880 RepID=A0ABQ5AYB9_9ASTR